ncbi:MULTISPECIES: hypothetical protein [unclassified Mesorhizobium]|nr:MULTISPECIES: hypothetical protein [unclassified Mesorhizobium]
MKTPTLLLLAVLVAGCVSTRHADLNRDYYRNCGYSMEELGLCSALPRP